MSAATATTSVTRPNGASRTRTPLNASEAMTFAHDAAGALDLGERAGEAVQALRHEGHVRAQQGDVGAGSAHGNPDVGGGESRGVIDAVADHRDRAACLELADGGQFVFG